MPAERRPGRAAAGRWVPYPGRLWGDGAWTSPAHLPRPPPAHPRGTVPPVATHKGLRAGWGPAGFSPLLGKQYPCVGEKQLNVLIRCTIDLAVFLLAGAPAEHGMAWHLTWLWVSAVPGMRGTWQRSRSGRAVLCKGWSYGWVCCSPREGAIFDKNTNPTLTVNFGVGNIQPGFSAVLFFRRFTVSPDR